MLMMILKAAVAAAAIAGSSWLAGKKPELAGFIIALPLASILALAFAHVEHKDAATSITFAKSIMIGVPVSWLFFVPFFWADRLNFGFWTSYAVGLGLLVIGYVVHQAVMGWIGQ